jgi:mRNA interferase HigB
MRVIARRTLRQFVERYPEAETPLDDWYRLMTHGTFRTPHELKRAFPYVSILKSGVAVFNVGGNKYRLAASLWYEGQVAYVKFVGTHEEYDKLDL